MIRVPKEEAHLYDVQFFNKGKAPYVRNLLDYEVTPDGGHVTFDGYYYVEDSELPTVHELYFSKRQPEPYKVDGNTYHYHFDFHMEATVEIMERETGRITDQISKETDSDGEEMNICFFPTKIQRLHFRVIKLHRLEEGLANATMATTEEPVKVDK